MATATRRKRTAKPPRAQVAQPIRKPRESAPAVLTFRSEFGVTRKALSRMTGLSERTLANWETGVAVGEAARRILTAIERFLRALAEVVRKEAIAGWLEQPNDAFGGLKPVEVLERGEIDRLWRMIYFLGSGDLS